MAQKNWRKNQSKDSYFIKARKLGYRSRSVFKLIEINKKYNILKKESLILDIGSSPGGWSEFIVGNYQIKKHLLLDLILGALLKKQ